MFFPGTLQEGITAALQQAKTVVCFVTDNGTESTQWEQELLVQASVKPLLDSQAILLRLEAGSEGEGFLAQLYPIPKKPTLVIIKNGELKEYIAAGVTNDIFTSRLQKALQPSQSGPMPATQSTPVATASSSSADTASQATASSSSNGGASNPQVQSMLNERAARLEAQQKKEVEEAKRQRAAMAQAKADDLAAHPEKRDDPQNKHAEQVRRQKREAQAERARILQQIADDKAARKARQNERQAERQAERRAEEEGLPFAPASPLLPSGGRLSEHCALQVRLLDGATIRSKFSSLDTLAKDVRQWVDESRTDQKVPYTFKLLLTPLPNKTIDVTEESKTLQELGLTPSATLILLPVTRSATAYAANAGGNPISRLFAYIYAMIAGFFTLIGSFFSTLFSTSGAPAARGPADAAQGRATGRDSRDGRVGGPQGSNARRNDQQFYNGNSTNFEPNHDEDE